MKLVDALKEYKGLWVSSPNLPVKYRIMPGHDESESVPEALLHGDLYQFGTLHLEDLEDEHWDLDRVPIDDIPTKSGVLSLASTLLALATGCRVWVDGWEGYLHKPANYLMYFDKDGLVLERDGQNGIIPQQKLYMLVQNPDQLPYRAEETSASLYTASPDNASAALPRLRKNTGAPRLHKNTSAKVLAKQKPRKYAPREVPPFLQGYVGTPEVIHPITTTQVAPFGTPAKDTLLANHERRKKDERNAHRRLVRAVARAKKNSLKPLANKVVKKGKKK